MRLIVMGRFILLQDHLPLMLDGLCQRLHIGRIRGIVDVTGNAGAVIDACQLPLQVPLEHIVVVDTLDEPGRHIGLLLREVYQPIEIRQSPCHLPHGKHVAVELVHHEPRLPSDYLPWLNPAALGWPAVLDCRMRMTAFIPSQPHRRCRPK